MKLQTETRWNIFRTSAIVLFFCLAAFPAGHAAEKAADKAADKKDKAAKTDGSHAVDSGTFGIFVKGQRVATETFTVQQSEGGSDIRSQLKESMGTNPASQKSNLEINSNGELMRYEWSQSSGGSLTVFPDNDFLKERITTSTSAKAAEQAFLLPTSTSVLDNNFFVHREILAWRYLSSACKTDAGGLKCPQEATDFGSLVPQDRLSMPVRMELVGKQKINIRGVERDLVHLKLTGESFEWGLWLDDQDHYKLIRAEIPADNTEVTRD